MKYHTKMANTKSIQKIKEYLNAQDKAVSISDISSNVNLKFSSVRDCVDFLEDSNQLNIMRSKGTTLIQLKNPSEVIQNATTN